MVSHHRPGAPPRWTHCPLSQKWAGIPHSVSFRLLLTETTRRREPQDRRSDGTGQKVGSAHLRLQAIGLTLWASISAPVKRT